MYQMELEVYMLDIDSPTTDWWELGMANSNVFFPGYCYFYPSPDLWSSHVPQPESIVIFLVKFSMTYWLFLLLLQVHVMVWCQ